MYLTPIIPIIRFEWSYRLEYAKQRSKERNPHRTIVYGEEGTV